MPPQPGAGCFERAVAQHAARQPAPRCLGWRPARGDSARCPARCPSGCSCPAAAVLSCPAQPRSCLLDLLHACPSQNCFRLMPSNKQPCQGSVACIALCLSRRNRHERPLCVVSQRGHSARHVPGSSRGLTRSDRCMGLLGCACRLSSRGARRCAFVSGSTRSSLLARLR